MEKMLVSQYNVDIQKANTKNMWKKQTKDKKQNKTKVTKKQIHYTKKKKKKKFCSRKIHESFVDQWIKKNVTSVSWWQMYVTYDITGK